MRSVGQFRFHSVIHAEIPVAPLCHFPLTNLGPCFENLFNAKKFRHSVSNNPIVFAFFCLDIERLENFWPGTFQIFINEFS